MLSQSREVEVEAFVMTMASYLQLDRKGVRA